MTLIRPFILLNLIFKFFVFNFCQLSYNRPNSPCTQKCIYRTLHDNFAITGIYVLPETGLILANLLVKHYFHKEEYEEISDFRDQLIILY